MPQPNFRPESGADFSVESSISPEKAFFVRVAMLNSDKARDSSETHPGFGCVQRKLLLKNGSKSKRRCADFLNTLFHGNKRMG
jgi:hypothetical protein